MKALYEEVLPSQASNTSERFAAAASTRPIDRLVPALSLWSALCGIFLGILCLVQNTYEAYPVPVLWIIGLSMLLLFFDVYRQYHKWDFRIALLAILADASLFLLIRVPNYVTGFQINGILHHSLFSSVVLLIISTFTMSVAIYYTLGATPTADDYSRYPFIVLPVVLILSLYLILINQLVQLGLSNFDWEILRQPFMYHSVAVKEMIAGDWPWWTSKLSQQAGMWNHFVGTWLLMLLTMLVALPIGLGSGVYINEYASERVANYSRFAISSLRSISLLILGITAYSIATYSTNTPLAAILRGTYFNGWKEIVGSGGSFLTASIVLSLLIIPTITRATEDGCRALPADLREGSLALGASEETTLRRVVLPWALPNIVTAVLLGCAEVAGSVAVLMFIAGRGDYGVGISRQVTSLAFLIFDANYGDKAFSGMMQPYQFMAALLLLGITLGMGLLALLTKYWLVRRYRGG